MATDRRRQRLSRVVWAPEWLAQRGIWIRVPRLPANTNNGRTCTCKHGVAEHEIDKLTKTGRGVCAVWGCGCLFFQPG